MKMITLVSQLAISMLTAVFISGAMGYAIDYFFGTSTLVFFLILGVLGGYRSCYTIICKYLGRDSLFDSDKKTQNEKADK